MSYPYINKKKDVCVFVVTKGGEGSFGISNAPLTAARQTCYVTSVDLTVISAHHNGGSYRWCQRGRRRQAMTSTVTWSIKSTCFPLQDQTRLSRANLSYSFALGWQLCYSFAVHHVSGSELPVEARSLINKNRPCASHSKGSGCKPFISKWVGRYRAETC